MLRPRPTRTALGEDFSRRWRKRAERDERNNNAPPACRGGQAARRVQEEGANAEANRRDATPDDRAADVARRLRLAISSRRQRPRARVGVADSRFNNVKPSSVEFLVLCARRARRMPTVVSSDARKHCADPTPTGRILRSPTCSRRVSQGRWAGRQGVSTTSGAGHNHPECPPPSDSSRAPLRKCACARSAGGKMHGDGSIGRLRHLALCAFSNSHYRRSPRFACALARLTRTSRASPRGLAKT